MTDSLNGPIGVADDQLFALAFYVVVDVSWSMENSGSMLAVNQIIPKVIDAIDASPTLADVVRFGAMDFSDDARVVLRLGDLRDITSLPTFEARGGTSYAAAFRLLRQEIDKDLAQLKGDNFRVYRPAVFFITDGEPTDSADDLRSAFLELTDSGFKARPNIIPFGVGQATKEMLEPWVFPGAGERKPMRSYVARDGVEPATAINQIAEVLISSIIASANSVTSGGQSGGFIPPDEDDLSDDWI